MKSRLAFVLVVCLARFVEIHNSFGGLRWVAGPASTQPSRERLGRRVACWLSWTVFAKSFNGVCGRNRNPNGLLRSRSSVLHAPIYHNRLHGELERKVGFWASKSFQLSTGRTCELLSTCVVAETINKYGENRKNTL